MLEPELPLSPLLLLPLSPLELPLSFAMRLRGLAAMNTVNDMAASEASKTITNRLRLFIVSNSPPPLKANY